jgi:hypothetical protein
MCMCENCDQPGQKKPGTTNTLLGQVALLHGTYKGEVLCQGVLRRAHWHCLSRVGVTMEKIAQDVFEALDTIKRHPVVSHIAFIDRSGEIIAVHRKDIPLHSLLVPCELPEASNSQMPDFSI